MAEPGWGVTDSGGEGGPGARPRQGTGGSIRAATEGSAQERGMARTGRGSSPPLRADPGG